MPRIPNDQRWRLFAESPIARLATVTADAHPHVVPCCFVLHRDESGGDVIYSVVDAKPKSTMALKRLDNVRAMPAASLVVDHYADDWSQLWWVRADGQASVLEPGEESRNAIARLSEKYRQYREQPPPGSVVRVSVTAWSDWTASPVDSVG